MSGTNVNKKRNKEEEEAADPPSDEIVAISSNKKAKVDSGGDVTIQVGLYDAAKEANEALMAYATQTIEVDIQIYENGEPKTVKKKVQCVMTGKYVASRLGQGVVAGMGEFLKKLIVSSVQSSMGLPFAHVLPLPPGLDIVNILTKDVPDIIGSVASEFATETVMFFADIAVADDKMAFYESIIQVDTRGVATAPLLDQIRTACHMVVVGDRAVNLLRPAVQYCGKIVGNVFKNAIKVFAKRFLTLFLGLQNVKDKFILVMEKFLEVFSRGIGWDKFVESLNTLVALGVQKMKKLVQYFKMLWDLPGKMTTALQNVVGEVKAREETAKEVALRVAGNVEKAKKLKFTENLELAAKKNISPNNDVTTTEEGKTNLVKPVVDWNDEWTTWSDEWTSAYKWLTEFVDDKDPILNTLYRTCSEAVFQPIQLEFKNEKKKPFVFGKIIRTPFVSFQTHVKNPAWVPPQLLNR